MVVAPDPDAQTTCGGALTPAAGGTSVGYSGGSVGALQTCTISVRVQARRAGALENISGNLTSDLPGTSARAEATLTVNEAPLSVSMMFSPTAIAPGEVSTLSYELTNSVAIEATDVSLSDTLPPDVVGGRPCPMRRTTAAAR